MEERSEAGLDLGVLRASVLAGALEGATVAGKECVQYKEQRAKVRGARGTPADESSSKKCAWPES